jgi:hypothetical protein
MKLSQKVNRLFLMWNCHECVLIKESLNSDIIFEDDISGNDGQILTIFYTFNNNSTRDLLDSFGLKNLFTPVLLTHDKKTLTDPYQIVNFLKESNIIRDTD